MSSVRQIQFPIFVRAKTCGDVTRYLSVHDLRYKLERTAVTNDGYEAWDATGARLSLGILEPMWLKIELQDGPPVPAELATALAEYAEKFRVNAQRSDLSAGKYPEALEQVETRKSKPPSQVA